VELLDRAGLERCAREYDRCVAADPDVDGFCTRSDWILSFHDAFHPRHEVIAARGGGAFVALQSQGFLLAPLESMWSFASPLVGAGAVELLLELLRERELPRGYVQLTGLPPRAPRSEALVRALARTHDLGHASTTVRCVAQIDDLDRYLARRSAKHRAGLRAAARRARAESVCFETLAPRSPLEADAVYERVLAVERRSWKAATDNGVDRGPMREFYAAMFPRLAARGALRVWFATRDGDDLGYLSGGLAGATFRGLQFSFDDRYREAGLGNVLQLEMLVWLAEAGAAEYALGGQSEYKARWAEQRRETPSLLLFPKP
jgi:hypothetical protein